MAKTDPEDILVASYRYGSSNVTMDDYSTALRTFLFGFPISHSLAPLLHSTLFKGLSLPWTYTLMETEQGGQFLSALKQPDIVGCAVTMPYKVKMVSVVDTLTDEARTLGAINTVFKRKAADGTQICVGTNTDTIGVREAFMQNIDGVAQAAAGRPAMVIGGGGACRAAIYALWKWLGATQIYMVNRIASEVESIIADFRSNGVDAEFIYVSSTEQAHKLETPFLVVGTVPDLTPQELGEVTAREIIEHFLARSNKGSILEMCYHPHPRTTFYTLGERAGWQMVYGTEAMIWQGVAQQVLWSEKSMSEFKLAEAKRAIDSALH